MTTHWTSWKDAPNACANVGKATLAMLVPSEASSMESERLASAQRTEGVGSALRAVGSSRPAIIGFDMNLAFWRLPKRSCCQEPSPSPDMAERARFALYSCVWRHITIKTVLGSMHVDPRSQPACRPRCAARGGQRCARSPAVTAQPVGDEPGAGAIA